MKIKIVCVFLYLGMFSSLGFTHSEHVVTFSAPSERECKGYKDVEIVNKTTYTMDFFQETNGFEMTSGSAVFNLWFELPFANKIYFTDKYNIDEAFHSYELPLMFRLNREAEVFKINSSAPEFRTQNGIRIMCTINHIEKIIFSVSSETKLVDASIVLKVNESEYTLLLDRVY